MAVVPTPDHVVMIQRCVYHNKANIVFDGADGYTCYICNMKLTKHVIERPTYEENKDVTNNKG